ncbi:AraC family transcriptional regulator [Billgrantia pellis]|uniref:AraC family transcriptional regulator n=1 Tax=Billgrantia pellis TaxID=2606936 RepID=A0A7V7KGW5_9GAMM|nr:AraC family transcriptional regulator [Halomonas pellis]KAA0011300.1 AraC family transcriptional regulator [Halomonas pellis]
MTISLAPADELIGLLAPLAEREGFTETPLAGVSLMAMHRPRPRTPLIYEPGLFVVVQGNKIGYLGNREIHYGPGHYLVQTLPLPFECVTLATRDVPMLGLAVRLDPAMLGEMVAAMDEARPAVSGPDPVPMASVAMTEGMRGAVVRLLRALHDPAEAAAMGVARVRDILFEAMKGEQGPALRALVRHQGHYSRIVRVLSRLHTHFADDISVAAMAREANMSPSTFYLHFRQIAHASPLQYVKRLRLIKAQQLLLQEAFNVNQAAMRVGYRSVSQFSRDYKRYFGASPLRHRREEGALDDTPYRQSLTRSLITG